MRVDIADRKGFQVQRHEGQTDTLRGTSSGNKLSKHLQVRAHAAILARGLVCTSSAVALRGTGLRGRTLLSRISLFFKAPGKLTYHAGINTGNVTNSGIALILRRD